MQEHASVVASSVRQNGSPGFKVTGPPTKVADGVMTESTGAAQFTFASTGVFVAIPPVPEEGQAAVVWVDRSGHVTRAPGAPGAFDSIALAPDRHRIVLGSSRSTGFAFATSVEEPSRS